MPLKTADTSPLKSNTQGETALQSRSTKAPWIEKFRRVTSLVHYMPEVDGLRFLSLIMVVLVIHTSHFIDEKLFGNQMIPFPYLRSLVVEGSWGVPLFFIISAFILSMPFGKVAFSASHKKPIQLRKYYLRRLVRIEPPYIVALVIFFCAHIWVLHTYSFAQLIPHLGASVSYIHTIIYERFSVVLPIAWTLEVEAQFYLIAPVFFLLFKVKQPAIRRGAMLVVICLATVYWKDKWEVVPHLGKFIHYFFMGILLTDLYLNRVKFINSKTVCSILGGVFILGIFLMPGLYNSAGYYIKNLMLPGLFYIVLTNTFWKRIFSIRWITIIGGMCYSIYLLHFGILSVIGKLLLASGLQVNRVSYIPLYFIAFTAIILVGSAIFFLVVEKPFMKMQTLVK